ncbi:LacI family DNA-binding transcriptional regulator [Variovorax boronicumulans]|uniref:LacI family DNA-binding transcriptional regulator n=1 Tax=Variovorax boronicumulans TaxID=436515 RepID=UPI001C57319E
MTLRDVAQAADVSLGTASKVMAGRGGVSARRAESVHAAARALGYRHNGIAADLRRNRSNSIGLVIPDLRNSFFVDLIHALETFASADGYFLVLGHANENPATEMERIRFVLSRRVAGMILLPCQGHDHALAELRQCHVPVVMADRVNDSMPANTVATDSVHAAYTGTQHLLSLGHRRIAFAANTLDLTNTRDRVTGYSRAMEEAGAAPQLILCGTENDRAHPAMLEALLRPERPSALFTSGTPMTLAALSAIADADLHLPSEVSLLSFDDAPWMSVLSPHISAIRQPVEAISRAIWQLMLAELKGGSAAAPSHLSFKAELRPRQTTVAWPHRG